MNDAKFLVLMDFVAAMNGGRRIKSNGWFRYRFSNFDIVINDGEISFDYRDADCLASIGYFVSANDSGYGTSDWGRRYCVLKRGHEGLHKLGGYDEELRDGWFWDDVDGDAQPDPIVVGKRKG